MSWINAWTPPDARETRPCRRDRELRELAALAIGGILLVSWALAAGWPPRLLNRRLHKGGWQRVHQGAWAAPGRLVDWLTRLNSVHQGALPATMRSVFGKASTDGLTDRPRGGGISTLSSYVTAHGFENESLRASQGDFGTSPSTPCGLPSEPASSPPTAAARPRT
ncbi:type IV toxin-antitoxin system AbiEi family antitoxin domain-containing protein [[Kitasatospora] papulosa]|uniref:type IV toxin-antitoxin system AbiEi family antitoxin domain-containing protein n=1 Tax=[Kitasatospora] papulosa TaxID=1464011 RepID=UPI0035DBBA7B